MYIIKQKEEKADKEYRNFIKNLPAILIISEKLLNITKS